MSFQDKQFEKRLQRAKIQLLLDQPFFGTLATRLPNVEDYTIPTACTNGKEIRWNPKFGATLNDKQLQFVVAHEVLHVANGHTWRRDSRDPFSWNIAADKAINSILKDGGFEAPEGGVFPDAGDENHAAEHYYTLLPSGSGSGPNGKDPGGFGGVEDSPADEKTDLQGEWKIAVAQAAASAKKHGTLSGGLKRLVDEIVNPRVPWEVILRDFITRSARNDYSFSRANNRHTGRGFVLPTLISDELPPVVVVRDTSGSVDDVLIAKFNAEISSILEQFDTTINVFDCDTEIHTEAELTRADLPLKLPGKGGGGTSFKRPFQRVDEKELEPACLIYCTDGAGEYPKHSPEYPVLWVMVGNEPDAPFGETVRMD